MTSFRFCDSTLPGSLSQKQSCTLGGRLFSERFIFVQYILCRSSSSIPPLALFSSHSWLTFKRLNYFSTVKLPVLNILHFLFIAVYCFMNFLMFIFDVSPCFLRYIILIKNELRAVFARWILFVDVA